MGTLSLLPRYLLNMGLFSGLRTFTTVELRSKDIVNVTGYAHPVFLRPGTTDRKVFREVFLFREYQLTLPAPPAVIVDAGANIGLSGVFFARRYPQARIFSVEPDSGNFDVLLKNTGPYPNITAVQSAVWSTEAFLKIKDNQSDAWAFEVTETDANTPGAFHAISIEALMKKYQLNRIDLLKLDIEGAERDVFASHYEYWLPRTKSIVIELHDWIHEECSRNFFRTISQYRFSVVIHGGMLLLENLDLK